MTPTPSAVRIWSRRSIRNRSMARILAAHSIKSASPVRRKLRSFTQSAKTKTASPSSPSESVIIPERSLAMISVVSEDGTPGGGGKRHQQSHHQAPGDHDVRFGHGSAQQRGERNGPHGGVDGERVPCRIALQEWFGARSIEPLVDVIEDDDER